VYFVEYEVMRLHRFYVNKPLGEEIVVENVDGKELIHQWTHVFRYKSGDEVFLFSPHAPGKDFLYRISAIDKQAIALTLVSLTPNIIPSTHLTLVMALVKKDTFETIVRQATELGITRIIPLEASRSEKKNLNFDRLRAIAIEASEQSGRGTVPEITEILSFGEALTLSGESKNIIGSLGGEPLQDFGISGSFQKEKLSLWVGPEGGWTEAEETTAKEAAFFFLKCASTVLRADTAAVALISTLLSSLE
jgi:16S rRNA (uracil1498-N3)-methyltransferase